MVWEKKSGQNWFAHKNFDMDRPILIRLFLSYRDSTVFFFFDHFRLYHDEFYVSQGSASRNRMRVLLFLKDSASLSGELRSGLCTLKLNYNFRTTV